METPGYMDIAGAAQWSSTSTRTIERWIQRGLPVYRVSNGKRLLKIGDLERFMTQQTALVPDLGRMVDEVASSLRTPRGVANGKRP